MLWKKAWWETRWAFLIFLIILFLACLLTAMHGYDAADWAARLRRSADLSEGERQALNSYQGRAWALGFKMFFSFIWADFAVVLGAVCLMTFCSVTPSHGAAGLFTLSLPASRRKVLLSQAAVGFGEIFLIALIPSLSLPFIARLNGQWFSWSDALIHALLLVFGGTVFFFFSFLLTVILGNWLAAFVIVEAALFALLSPFNPFGTRPWWNILGVMAGESHFYHGQIPWLGLAVSLILSAVFMFAAIRIYERRDL
jgi:ABC-2 type transport system permease protein